MTGMIDDDASTYDCEQGEKHGEAIVGIDLLQCKQGNIDGCTDAIYLFLRNNDFDEEENVIVLDPPPQFSAHANAAEPTASSSSSSRLVEVKCGTYIV